MENDLRKKKIADLKKYADDAVNYGCNAKEVYTLLFEGTTRLTECYGIDEIDAVHIEYISKINVIRVSRFKMSLASILLKTPRSNTAPAQYARANSNKKRG